VFQSQHTTMYVISLIHMVYLICAMTVMMMMMMSDVHAYLHKTVKYEKHQKNLNIKISRSWWFAHLMNIDLHIAFKTSSVSSYIWDVINESLSKSVLFEGGGSLWPQILDGRGGRLQTAVGVRKLEWLLFHHKARVWQTDRQTDRRTVTTARPR